MIQIRTFDRATDYPLAERWWQAHQWPAPPLAYLPALGQVAEKIAPDGTATPHAMAWLYLDNSSPVAMLEWIVTNPENSPKSSAAALLHLVRCLRSASTALGYGPILASCRQPSLARLLEKCGFQTTDTAVTHLISLTS